MQRRWDLYHLGSNKGRVTVEAVKVAEEEGEDVGVVKVEVAEGRKIR